MTETPTITLTEFLHARIAEDEDRANGSFGARWRYQLFDDVDRVIDTEDPEDVIATCEHDVEAFHIARFDPARVLAECAAKRKIIARYVEAEEWREPEAVPLHAVVADLAAVYADHPDYRQEWRP